jgi:outer membrane lipopolysaccharide assembly protein LptE/RlpB
MNMFSIKNISFLVLATCLVALATWTTGCGVYKFNDISIDPNIKSVRINFIENRAPYVNPQLSPTLTDRVKQKIVNQTRLTQTNNENAHYDISGYISDYSVSTTGVSQNRGVMNRLTVAVHITVKDQLNNTPPKEIDVSRSFEFAANISLQAAESRLMEEMVRNLTDDIFNRIFSAW